MLLPFIVESIDVPAYELLLKLSGSLLLNLLVPFSVVHLEVVHVDLLLGLLLNRLQLPSFFLSFVEAVAP